MYCAACRGHGTSEHDLGCLEETDPVKRLEWRVQQLEERLDRLHSLQRLGLS